MNHVEVMIATAAARCQRKPAYLSQMLAENMEVLLRWTHPGYNLTYPYQCAVCGDWHLSRRLPAQRGPSEP